VKSFFKGLRLVVVPATVAIVGVVSGAFGAAVYNFAVLDDKVQTFFWATDAIHNLGLYSSADPLAGQAPGATVGPYIGFTPGVPHITAGLIPPVLSACGTTPLIIGDDKDGQVTMGTGTPAGCVITFASAYVSAPLCDVTWQATPLAAQSYAISATAITLTQTATSSNKVNYHCVAQAGG
jgi:hypothetical protein